MTVLRNNVKNEQNRAGREANEEVLNEISRRRWPWKTSGYRSVSGRERFVKMYSKKDRGEDRTAQEISNWGECVKTER